jgi:Spy/CpxP family protein refolding chaperone
MSRLSLLALLGGMCVLAGGLVGQEPKKDEPKKDEPAAKLKGKLPSHWGKIGLTDSQKQTIYQIQGKYDPEIEKLDAKLAEMKATRDKEMKAVLTADQKKALETAILGKDK